MLVACPTDSDDDGNDTLPRAFEASELARSESPLPTTAFKSDYYRSNFTTFSIKVSTTTPGEYKIGARISSAAAPTTAELIAATTAVNRDISDTAINVYLPYHIDGTFFDTGATQSSTTASSTALAAGIDRCTIYATLANGSGSVEEVLSITTDAAYTDTANVIYGLPRDGVSYAAKTADPMIFTIKSPLSAININIGSTTISCGSSLCVPSPIGLFNPYFVDNDTYFFTYPTITTVIGQTFIFNNPSNTLINFTHGAFVSQ